MERLTLDQWENATTEQRRLWILDGSYLTVPDGDKLQRQRQLKQFPTETLEQEIERRRKGGY